MTTVTCTEFRNNASGLLTRVEKGDVLRVLRHGRPIADIRPVSGGANSAPSWRRPALRLGAKGAGLSAAILKERSDADVP